MTNPPTAMIEHTPFRLPRVRPLDEGEPAAGYRHTPAEEGGRTVAAWLETEMGLERPPEHMRMAAGDVVGWQLKTFLADVGPAQTLHFGHTDRLQLTGYYTGDVAANTDAPFLCYLSCNTSYVVDAFDVRARLEQLESEAFAAKVLRGAAGALSHVMPVWRAFDAWEFIRQTRWSGYQSEEDFLNEHRRMMAEDEGRDPDDIGLHELREFCESFAPMHWDVAMRLPDVYGQYDLGEDLPGSYEDKEVQRLLEAIAHADEKGRALKKAHGTDRDTFYTMENLHHSWSLVLNLEAQDGASLTLETFQEQMQHHYECADWPAPIVIAGVDPGEEESLRELAAMLHAVREARHAAEALWRLLDPDEWEAIEEEVSPAAGPAPEEAGAPPHPPAGERPPILPPLPSFFTGENGHIPEAHADAAKKAQALTRGSGAPAALPAEVLAAFA